MKKSFILVILLSVLFCLSCCNANTGSAENFEALQMLQSDYDVLSARFHDLQSEYSQYKEKTADWAEYSEVERKAAVEAAKRQDEISRLDNEIASKKESIASLETEIEELNKQIESLQGEIIRIKGEPISFPAGYFTAGTDFPIGRYKVYNGNSNFVVRSASGRLRVNIILGSADDSFRVKEYIYNFETGDEIESSSRFIMVPVE